MFFNRTYTLVRYLRIGRMVLLVLHFPKCLHRESVRAPKIHYQN